MISQQQALSIFRNMLLMRRFEEAVIGLWETVDTESYRHVYIGQEAVGATIMALLREDDLLVTTHRNHGHIVGRGADPGRALAEILGRVDGYNRGRGGSSSICARDFGFLATTGVVGGGVGLGTGGAFAQKVKGEGGVSVAFFGDGGLEEGIAFESMNMAALFGLPVLYVCENNSVGVTTGRANNEWSSSSMAAATLGDIPRSLCIETEVVDGADVEAVWDAASGLLERMRRDPGPAFVEMRTHRWPGSRSFDPKLVTGTTDLQAIWDQDAVQGEHADWILGYDPIVFFGRKLLESGRADKAMFRSIDEQVTDRIDTARSFALASAELEPDSGLTGTFA